jgi:hypothetical protein
MLDDLNNLQAHPFADMFPMYKIKELEELAMDIQMNGLLQKIILLEGQILDGRNRYAALKLAGVAPTYEWHFTAFDGTEAEGLRLVGALNLRRRHLTTGQRAMIASTIATLQHGGHRLRDQRKVDGVTSADAASAMRVSPFMVRAARRIRRTAAPALVDMCERGEVTIASAELVATLTAKRQATLTTPDLVNEAAAKLREAKRPFVGFTERRLVATIGDLGEELSARGFEVVAREAEPDSLHRIEITLRSLQQLRASIRVVHGAVD